MSGLIDCDRTGLFAALIHGSMCGFGSASWQLNRMIYGWLGLLKEFRSATRCRILGLQSNEDGVLEEDQSGFVRCEEQRYHQYTILPTKIHGRRFQVAVPGVCNVLADVVQQNVHCEGLGLSWMDQNIVSEQCVFFQSAK